MPNNTHTNDLSAADFVHGIDCLPASELEKVFEHILALRARSKVKNLSAQESQLLQQINQPVPQPLQQRFDQLREKKHSYFLTEAEQQEYLWVIEQIEQCDAERLEYLIDLAKLRRIPLRQLMQDLGIQQPEYV